MLRTYILLLCTKSGTEKGDGLIIRYGRKINGILQTISFTTASYMLYRSSIQTSKSLKIIIIGRA